MSMQTKTIGRMPTDHGPYDPQLSYGKKFIVTLFDCAWESKHDNNTSAPATLNAQAGTITENTTDWKKKWGSYKQWLIDNGYQKMDASNVKDGNNTQNTINSETNTRLQSLESSVGSGGSVDLRIEAAKSEIKGNASSSCDTLGEAEGLINGLDGRVDAAETDIANLQQLYNNLQQSKPEPVTALPSTGQQQGVIYRLAGNTSYSDYMWNGSSWVLMGTYDNAIDDVPTSGSNNLVKSGGVYESLYIPYFVKNQAVQDHSDALVNGVSLYAILRSILYINIQSLIKDYSNVTLGLGYIEYGELKSGNKRSFRVVLKEYNTNNSSWERSSIEVQNFDIQPLTGAIYRLYTKTNIFSIECIINYESMTYGNAYTLDNAFTNIPKFIFNNVWILEKEKDEKLNKLAGDFSCFRKRLQNSVDTNFVALGGSSDVGNYSCFDIYKSILSLKLYGFEEGLYGIRYISRGEAETLKYRFIIVKYNKTNNTWADYFDTGDMLALEQEQDNSLIVWDATVNDKRAVMEIDFNLTPSIGFYASLYASGAAPQFVIKQDCFVAKQSSETVADFIQDLPVSDGSTISSGYAYIDSATYNVKVKQ